MRFPLLLLTFALLLSRPALGDTPVLIVGDSISAGYGIATDQGWVDMLARHLEEHPCACQVVNASISGETTDGGLRRLPALLEAHRPDIVVIELGGNDGLRGFPLSVTRDNLSAMITLSQDAGASVLLLGMQIPPNYGPRYSEGFKAVFSDLASTHQTALLPFLLDGVATRSDLMQGDGIHPNDDAQPLLLANVLPALEPLLRRQRADGSTVHD